MNGFDEVIINFLAHDGIKFIAGVGADEAAYPLSSGQQCP